jgi:molybdopterin-guanine dinucleotide biosynthesis protein A
VSCSQALDDLLSGPGPRRVAVFAESVRMRYVEFHVRTVYSFANVNSRDELAQAHAEAYARPDAGVDEN